MDTMTCEQFQARLMALVGDEPGPADSSRERAALAEHASRCRLCEGADDLLTLLEEPARRRDDRDDPGAAYWASFNRRLEARLQAEPPPRAAGEPRSRRGRWLVAAASVAALGLASWLALRTVPEDLDAAAPRVSLTPVAERGIADEPPIDELSWVAGWGGAWEPEAIDGPALFPELESLDDDDRAALLAWLENEDAS